MLSGQVPHIERTLATLKSAFVPVPVTSARMLAQGCMLIPVSLNDCGGGGGGGGAAGAAGAPRPPPAAGGAPSRPAGGAPSRPPPPPRAPRPPPGGPGGGTGAGGMITTPASVQGLASVPSPLTHPVIVRSVVAAEPPCAARPAPTAATKTRLPKTSFMTPPPVTLSCDSTAERSCPFEAATLYVLKRLIIHTAPSPPPLRSWPEASCWRSARLRVPACPV